MATSTKHRELVARIEQTARAIVDSMTDKELQAMEIGKTFIKTIDIPAPVFQPAWTKPVPVKEPVTVPAEPEKVPVTVGVR